VIEDPVAHESKGAGPAGAFGWPGAFGTWWQADPVNQMILIYLVQDSVTLSAEAVTGARQVSLSRQTMGAFQKLSYAALKTEETA
jgi:CubicO group peptidase (beta-lactamase class C family)